MINIYNTGKYTDQETGLVFDPCTCEELFNYHDLDFLFYDKEHKVIWYPLFNENIAYSIAEANNIEQFFDNCRNALDNLRVEFKHYLDWYTSTHDTAGKEEAIVDLEAIDREQAEINKKEKEILAKYFHRY